MVNFRGQDFTVLVLHFPKMPIKVLNFCCVYYREKGIWHPVGTFAEGVHQPGSGMRYKIIVCTSVRISHIVCMYLTRCMYVCTYWCGQVGVCQY